MDWIVVISNQKLSYSIRNLKTQPRGWESQHLACDPRLMFGSNVDMGFFLDKKPMSTSDRGL